MIFFIVMGLWTGVIAKGTKEGTEGVRSGLGGPGVTSSLKVYEDLRGAGLSS